MELRTHFLGAWVIDGCSPPPPIGQFTVASYKLAFIGNP